MSEGPFFLFFIAGEVCVTATGFEEFATKQELVDYMTELRKEETYVSAWIIEGGVKRELNEVGL